MLSALELNGFKSFADRTRFEFPAGITVVVGPNGSGKSNVVDAIKWVLGTQSAKALRGKEMTDVIFGGSRARRPAGAAEASIILDNSARILDHDAQEIQITRRAYRSGEGEYLINRQPCRLRDVRDLLAGAGVSAGGYCIIEQGRVDAFLQASPQDRRLFFEEAAGISRFRVKREEAARRLDRIQQSLLRLADIVSELQTRLKTVRSQAAKAQRHAELARRIESLRTQAALDDWRQFTRQIDEARAAATLDQSTVDDHGRVLAERDAQLAEIDGQVERLGKSQREALSADASSREKLAQCQSMRDSYVARIDELEQEVVRLAHQLLTLTSRAGDAHQLVADTGQQLHEAQEGLAALRHKSAQSQEALATAHAELVELRRQGTASAADLDEMQREAMRRDGERQRIIAHLQATASTLAARDDEAAPLVDARTRLAADATQAATESTRLAAHAERTARDLQVAQDELALDREQLVAAQKRAAELDGRLTGARERIAVLEELEARLDGLTSGAKAVLRAAREDPEGPFRSVRGVVADLLHVDADTAPLVEIALGERANYLVVSETTSLAPALAAAPAAWSGRTTFLRLDVTGAASVVDRLDLAAEPGVIGRADTFVETEPELAPLVRRLLGRYWLVDALPTALHLSSTVGRGLNFVTVAGEAVLADGTLAVGPRQSVAGMLSRRSELRVLRDEIASLEAAVAAARRDGDLLEARLAKNAASVQQLGAANAQSERQSGEQRLRAAALAERLRQADARLATLQAEQTQLAAQRQQLSQDREVIEQRLQELRAADEKCRSEMHHRKEQQSRVEASLSDLQRAVTDERVELARGEQRVEGLARQMEQLARDHAERDRGLEETRGRAAQCQTQREGLKKSVDSLSVELEQLAGERARLAAHVEQLDELRRLRHAERGAIARAAEAVRTELIAAQSRLQSRRLELQQLEQQRTTMSDRLKEDYGIDLAALAATAPLAAAPLATAASDQPAASREATDAEIRELRSQIQAGGPVNLESLVELEALEGRAGGLVAQYEDLEQTRARLEQVIAQINGESRQLFLDAVTEVRTHFQDIFRRLFAGGEADIVLEEHPSGDVLECGVAIVARPPGKQPRNISLLSGGERTLTCVALLLAMFRSRPSPFCILDEVDAALDEANIDRFVGLLREFMQSTQFVVITHSKRTMTCANALHGVTMQETGVSKRVSVRFEEVGDNGRLRSSAGAQDPLGDQAQARAA